MKRKQGWSAGKRPVISSSYIRMASPAVCTLYSAIALGRSCAFRRSSQTKGIAIMIASCIDRIRYQYQYSDALFHEQSAARTSWQKDESRVRHRPLVQLRGCQVTCENSRRKRQGGGSELLSSSSSSTHRHSTFILLSFLPSLSLPPTH
jgi:hypothetical protein